MTHTELQQHLTAQHNAANAAERNKQRALTQGWLAAAVGYARDQHEATRAVKALQRLLD